jgi:hypothetical protein
MGMTWKVLMGLAAIGVACAFLLGGRYTATQQGRLLFVIDRFTGAVRMCDGDVCRPLIDQKAAMAIQSVKPIPPPPAGFERVTPEAR